MNKLLRTTISKLYDPVSAVVEKLVYGHMLNNTMKNKAIKNKTDAKEQQQDNDEQYDTVPKIKFMHKGICIKELRLIGNLNSVNIKMTMANLTQHTEMQTKVTYSFKSKIY